MLGVFRRDDGAIFLGIPDQNGENEHLANVKPVAAFAFSSADAAMTAREGAIVRLAKHLGSDGLLAGLSVGQAVNAVRAEAAALGLEAQFVRVTTEAPDSATTRDPSRALGWIILLAALGLIIAAMWPG
jgi:hypothetical protein